MKENKKLFTKIGCAIVGIAMAIGVGIAASRDGIKEAKAVTSSYTLTMKSNGDDSDGTSALSGTATATYVDSGAEYVSSVTASKCYLGKSSTSSLKFGTSSAKGTIQFNLSNAGQQKATKVSFEIATWNTDGSKNIILKLNNATSSDPGYKSIATGSTGEDFSTYEVDWDGTTTLTSIAVEASIATKCRYYLKTITVTYNVSSDPAVSTNPESLFFRTDSAAATVTATPSNFSGTPSYAWTVKNGSDDCLTLTNANQATVTVAPKAGVTELSTATLVVTATYNTQEASVEVAVTVDKGGASLPYTVSEARAAIDASRGLENAYVSGIVYFVESFNSTYNSITYWISDSGFGSKDSKDGLEVYGGLNIEDEDPFSGANDLAFGNIVTVKGGLVKYNSTYEFGQNNRLVNKTERSLTKIEVSGTLDKTSYFTSEEFDPTGLTFKPVFSAAPTNPNVEISSSEIEWPALTDGMTSITGTYTYNGVDYSTDPISITAADDTLSSIEISGDMTKKVYKDGDSWDPAGLVVTAVYTSGTRVNVTASASWSYSATLAVGVTSLVVTASYTADEVTKSASTSSISVTVARTPDLQILPSDFSTEGYDKEHPITAKDFASTKVMQSTSVIQMQKTNGYLYSTSALGTRIEMVEVNITDGGVKLFLGNAEISEKPESGEVASFSSETDTLYVATGSFTYLAIAATDDATVKINSINIWYSNEQPEITVSPDTFSFEQTNSGNVEVTITKEHFGEVEVAYAVSSSDQTVVANSAINIAGNTITIAKSNINIGTTTITVQAKVADVVKAEDTFTVTCTAHNRQFLSYAITAQASKKTFDAGDTFSIEGLVVTGTFDAEPTTQDITNLCTYKLLSDQGQLTEVVPGTTKLAGGDYKVKIIYSGQDTLEYSIKVLTLSSIAVLTKPTKTTYRIGETINLTGMVLEGTKSDGSKVTISEGFTSSTLDSSTAGKKSVTITYNGLTTTLEVTVVGDIYYSKIASASDLKAGDKILIVAELPDGDARVAASVITSKILEAKEVTIADGKIKQTDAIQACEFTLGGQAGAWTLTGSDGKLLGVSAASNGSLVSVDASSETKPTWTITLKDGKFNLAYNEEGYGSLQYNATNPRFTNYPKGGQKDVCLYKVGAAAPVDPTEPTVTKIEIESMPTKTQYNVGDSFEQAGLSIKVTYSDGNTAVVSTGFTCTGFSSTAAGENTITVEYEGKSTTFKVKVVDSSQPGTKTLSSISVRNAQETYDYGQEIDKTKLTVIATYSDNSTATVTNYTLSGYDKNKAGQQTVTVSYTEGGVTKTATFTVTVNAQPTDPIEAARQAALNEIQAYVAELGESNYSAENWAKIQDYLSEAPEILAGLDTQEKIERYVTAFKNYVGTIPTSAEEAATKLIDAKNEALSALAEYYNAIDPTQYDQAGIDALAAAYNDGKDAIEAATSIDEVATALQNAKNALDAVSKKPAAPARRCGGDIAATSIILSAIALVGAGLLVFKKRKED